MSGIGHLAAGFAGKTVAPEAPLWAYLVASETNDLLYFVFSSTGIEPKAVTTMNFTDGVRYLTLVSNPWSHGLFMSVVWSALVAALVFGVYRNARIGVLFGLAVFSHWLLDLLMHSNLPLFFEGSPQIGLGLENSGAGFVFITVFDLAILAGGIFIYLRAKRQSKSAAKEIQ